MRATSATMSSVSEIGRVTNVVTSPWAMISARRMWFSSSGPSTKPRSSGAGSQPSLTSP